MRPKICLVTFIHELLQAYFIAFTLSPTCNPDRLFESLHFENKEAEINFIKARVKHESEVQEHSERLFNVLKDHDNDAVRKFVKLSSQFCCAKELNDMIYDWSEEEKTSVSPCINYMQYP